MYNPPKFSNELCAVLTSSSSDMESMLKESRKLSKGSDFVLMLRPSKKIEHKLVPAYIAAMIRHSEGTMHANSIDLEILLFVSGTMNIGNAIEDAGTNGNEFVVFSSSKKLLEGMVSMFGLKKLKEYPLRVDPKTSGSVAITAIKDDK